jgi:hypothetical protein
VLASRIPQTVMCLTIYMYSLEMLAWVDNFCMEWRRTALGVYPADRHVRHYICIQSGDTCWVCCMCGENISAWLGQSGVIGVSPRPSCALLYVAGCAA